MKVELEEGIYQDKDALEMIYTLTQDFGYTRNEILEVIEAIEDGSLELDL